MLQVPSSDPHDNKQGGAGTHQQRQINTNGRDAANSSSTPGPFSKAWLQFFNKLASIINAMGAIAATTSPTPTDLPTALTAITELQTIVNALTTAANKQ